MRFVQQQNSTPTSNLWDALKSRGFCNETTHTGAYPRFKLYSTHELWLAATASNEGADGKKGCLYLLIWIRWPGYVTVFTPPYGPGAYTHTKQQQHGKNLVAHITTAFVLLFLFFSVQLTYCASLFPKFPSLNSQRHQRSSLPCPPPEKTTLSLLPSLHQTILPTPAQITTPPSLGSILLSALSTPPLLISLFIFRILIGSPAPSCKPIQLPLLSSFA